LRGRLGGAPVHVLIEMFMESSSWSQLYSELRGACLFKEITPQLNSCFYGVCFYSIKVACSSCIACRRYFFGICKETCPCMS